jgi:hypothetical protein
LITVECALGRWVRDPGARSTLSVDGGTVVNVSAQVSGDIVPDVGLHALELSAAGMVCNGGQITAIGTERFRVSDVRGRLSPGCAVLAVCGACRDALISDVFVADSPGPWSSASVGAVRFQGSDGWIRGVHLEPQQATLHRRDFDLLGRDCLRSRCIKPPHRRAGL